MFNIKYKIVKEEHLRTSNEEIERLKNIIDELNYKIFKLENTEVTANKVIEKILKKGIKWYDWNELNDTEKKNYSSEAQRILKSEVFNNEVMSFIIDLTQEIAFNSKDHRETENLRYSINGLKALQERLEDIKYIEKEAEEDVAERLKEAI